MFYSKSGLAASCEPRASSSDIENLYDCISLKNLSLLHFFIYHFFTYHHGSVVGTRFLTL